MKLKTKKRFNYTITILLVLVMFMVTMPLSIIEVCAEEIQSIENSKSENEFVQTDKLESTDIIDSKQLDKAYILEENEEKRTINSKEFMMSDGTVVVQQFAQNIHYLDGDSFEEIDNTLVETQDENGKTVYENASNYYKVKINKNFELDKKLIEVKNGEYELSFTYIDNTAKNTEAKKHGVKNKKTKNDYKDKKLKTPKDFSSGEGKISYNNISENIDLEYEVKDNGIKENIIVKDYLTDYNFDFKIESKNLELQKNEDGSISAKDNLGNVKYTIPAPFMFDSNGEYNYDVEYILEEVDNKYILTVSADENWIETEAKLPVTIDPVIETWNDTYFSFKNVYQNGTSTTSGSEVYVGEKSSGNKSNAYFRFELASKGNNYALVNASVRVYHKTAGMGIFNGKAISYSTYIVDSEKLLSDITYTSKPSKLQFLKTINVSSSWSSSTATNVLDINPNTIKGDVLTVGLEVESGNESGGYAIIYTSGTNGIYLTLRYKQITGIDDSYSMESTSINGATAYVNKASGLLTLNCDLASVNNADNMPLKASLVYNSSYNDILTELGVPNMFGNDFKLNFQQYVKIVANQYITLYDADGSATILNYDTNDTYRTSDGMLTATVLGTQVTVFDSQYNKRIFNNGRLSKIYRGEETVSENCLDSRIEIIYASSSGTNANRISNVLFYGQYSDSYSSKMTFTYSNDTSNNSINYDKVNTVTTYYGTSQLLKYVLSYDTSGNLTTVNNYEAGVDAFKLEYDTDGYLESVFNHYKEGLCFTRLQYEERIWKINQLQGQNSNNAKWLDYIEFDYGDYYPLTKTYYYENGRNVSTGYTMFDIALNPISEWVEDRNGKIMGVNRGYHNFTYKQNAYLPNYTRENVSFEEKLNTTFSGTISLTTGQSTSGNVNSSSGITYNSYYKYGLTFLAESAYDMDLTVTFASVSKRIVLENGGKLYITLPTTYVQSGTFTFKNNGSSSATKISNVTYNVIDYVKETKSHGTEPTDLNVYSEIEEIIYTKKGEYEKRSYDSYQRLIETEKRSKQDTTLEVTTYTYKSDELSGYMQLQNVTTKRSGSTIYTENHTYTSGTNYTETTVSITKNGINKKNIKRTTYTSNGYTVMTRDENNSLLEQNYSIVSKDVRKESVKSNGITEIYEYDYWGNITNVTLKDSLNNTILSSTNNYTNGVNTGHTFGDNTYTRTYDSLGYVTSINHNGSNMLSYSYVDDTRYSYDNYLDSITYSNGQSEMYTYNGNSTIVDYVKNSAVSDTYTYNNDNVNRLTSSSHSKNGVELLNYNYGDLNSTTQSSLTITGLSYGAQLTTNYDDVLERVTSTSDIFTIGSTNTTYNLSYAYNYKGQLTNNSVGSYNSNVYYDGIDRVSRYSANNNTTSIMDRTYIYDTWADNSGEYATNRLEIIRDTTNNSAIAQSTYDTKGFVTSTQYNGKTFNYTYDDAGRLASETIDGTTKTYTYDSNNSIASVATGSSIVNYNFDSYGRITEYTENYVTKYFSYDAMGNPIKYKGTYSGGTNMVWSQGRKLESGTLNNNTFAYSYDMNGLRYKKTVNGNVTEYYLDGSTIIAENRKTGTSNNLIYYIYDMMGLSGFVYNGANYYYEKNTLGDIIGIRDSSGTQVATYTYDAWGNILTKTGSMADINPFRYRGYYYDTETGFYYLQTRYYDPTIRMFINADNYELLPTLSQTIGQLNLYAYANNNPIMFTDETGMFLISTAVLIGAIIGAIVGGIIAYNIASSNGSSGWELVGYTALGVLGGGVAGGLLGAGIAAIGPSIGALFAFSSGALAMSVSSSGIVAASAMTIGVGYILSKIPMQGPPNSFVQNGDSFGEYDINGNLTYRTDTGHTHFIKELQKFFKPHTHHFKWKNIDGVWRYIEIILPR